MATETTTPPHPFNYVDEDTIARLRSVGTRVRKSVTEGFQRTVSQPADSLTARKRLPFTQTPSFISSNDALREIYASRANTSVGGSTSAPNSPQQRPKRGHTDDMDVDADPLGLDEGDSDEDADTPMTAADIRAARTAPQEDKSKRQIKPLKRSASRGGVQSLPASMFRMGISDEPSAFKPTPVGQIVEEDDWSDANFGTAPPPVQLAL